MDTSPPLSSTQADDILIDEVLRNNDQDQDQEQEIIIPTPTPIIQSVERVIAPIQPPLQPGTPVQQNLTGGFTSTFNSANPTFATVKATTFTLAFGYPLNYVRALMQMGYEPLAAYRGTNIFGKEALYYPNAFRYLQYIYRQDGFLGLYRGFGCSLLSKVVCLYTTTKVDQLLGPVESRVPSNQGKPTWNTCMQKTLREVRCQSWGILVSHPFQVMALRCMGQFIGGENIYSSINIFQNFHEIYQRQGLGGFFVGIIPRWLLEITSIVITNIIVHLLKSQIATQNELTGLYDYIASLAAQTVTYPLSVVTTVTAINRSGLRAGVLPLTPIYANWQEAYKSLSKTDQLKRGSSLFNRAVFGTTGIPAPGTPIPNA